MKTLLRQATATTLATLLAFPTPAILAQETPTKEDDEEVIILSPFEVSAEASPGYSASTTLAGTRLNTSLQDIGNAVTTVTAQFLSDINAPGSGNLGATVGGVQDINFFRSGAGRGDVPHPDTITAEGLFSEHDLPIDLGVKSNDLFVVQAAAIPAQFAVMPEVTHLVQLGFSSGLAAKTWQRAPLNLVAVVDKSGSMDGHPLALVRDSLHEVLRQLREGDQLSIVLYGDRAHEHLAPTKINPQSFYEITNAIDDIASQGSTNMEDGLKVGYGIARATASQFDGTTRVMLFTDERPNVGNTSAAGFMGLAEAAAQDGIGLTTIGVGVQFGTELAEKISGVRGGNQFFFPNAAEMTQTFVRDFDTMVTELAHDFRVKLNPRAGFKIAGVFGLPADLLKWEGDALVLDVATIFLSKNKGGIYFALSQKHAMPTERCVASVEFSYTVPNQTEGSRTTTDVPLLEPSESQLGLVRGHALIDEYLTLRRAAAAHLFDNDQQTAWQLTHDLKKRFAALKDPALAPEQTLIANVHRTFAFLAGRGTEIEQVATESPRLPTAEVDPLTGLPERS
jgi:Ca-activated chloride channel family protein